MSESGFVLKEQLGQKADGLATIEVDRKKAPLADVDVLKTRIRKCCKRHGCGLNLRIRFGYDAPSELRVSCSSMLMALEKVQRKCHHSLVIRLEAHGSM